MTVRGAAHPAPEVPLSEHHIVISADTHCGAELRDYRPYLESKYHRDFDEWADGVERSLAAAAAAHKGRKSPRNVGVDGDPVADGDRNWSMERRLREQTADGVVGEVMFPNTLPPFAPAPRPPRWRRPSTHPQLRAPLGGPAGPQPLDARHGEPGARALRRHRPDLPWRRGGLGGRDRMGRPPTACGAGSCCPGAPPDSPFEPL